MSDAPVAFDQPYFDSELFSSNSAFQIPSDLPENFKTALRALLQQHERMCNSFSLVRQLLVSSKQMEQKQRERADRAEARERHLRQQLTLAAKTYSGGNRTGQPDFNIEAQEDSPQRKRENEAAQYQRAKAELEAQHEQEVRELQRKVALAESERDVAYATLREHAGASDTGSVFFQALQQETAAKVAEKEIQIVTDHFNRVKMENDILSAANREQESQISGLKRQLEAMQSQLETVHAGDGVLSRVFEALSTMLSSHGLAPTGVGPDLPTSIQMSMVSLNSFIQRLRSDLDRANSENREALAQIAALQMGAMYEPMPRGNLPVSPYDQPLPAPDRLPADHLYSDPPSTPLPIISVPPRAQSSHMGSLGCAAAESPSPHSSSVGMSCMPVGSVEIPSIGGDELSSGRGAAGYSTPQPLMEPHYSDSIPVVAAPPTHSPHFFSDVSAHSFDCTPTAGDMGLVSDANMYDMSNCQSPAGSSRSHPGSSF